MKVLWGKILSPKGKSVSLKIVLADDSLTAQNMGKKILAEAGYEVIAVSNGAQAMKKIVSDKPDLVVLDVYMPGYTGLELCERLRNSHETARTPVLLTVGKMEAFKTEEVNRVGADGLIIKPFEATELVAVVKKLAESLASATRPRKQAESVAKKAVEPEPEAASVEPEFEIQHHTIQVPREIASEPVSGTYFLPEEDQQPAAVSAPEVAQTASPAAAPIEFEVEHEAPPVQVDAGPGMASAAGFSGVFEMEPTAAHAAVDAPAEPAPVEEFERFSATPAEPQPEHRVAAETGGTTFAHEFQIDESVERADEPRTDGNAGPLEEAFSAAPVETGLPSFQAESFDRGHSEPVIESVAAQTLDVLPELAAWDEPLPSASSQSSWEDSAPRPEFVVAEPSAAEFAATGSVWVAEETEIEPQESAISLHKQMQQQEGVDGLAPEPTAPAMSAEAAFESWEVPEPPVSAAAHQEAESSEPRQTEILPEFEPNPYAAPGGTAELKNTDHSGSVDFPAEPAASTEEQLSAPAPEPESESRAAAEIESLPPIAIPLVSEIPADPIRIARIVEEALQRLKPQLIAAVTRELERKDP
jgi:DNA-binding response OmpR family regulator